MQDSNGDGVDEAVFTCNNNRLKCSAIFVLDPQQSEGVSPPYERGELDLSSVKRGNQLHYLLFHTTEIGGVTSQYPYPYSTECRKISLNEVEVFVDEGTKTNPGGVIYRLDSHFRTKGAVADDCYRKKYQVLREDKSISDIPLSDYEDSLRDRVTYFIDGEYVTESELRAEEAKRQVIQTK